MIVSNYNSSGIIVLQYAHLFNSSASERWIALRQENMSFLRMVLPESNSLQTLRESEVAVGILAIESDRQFGFFVFSLAISCQALFFYVTNFVKY